MSLITPTSGSSLLDINGNIVSQKEINPNAYYFVDWGKLSSVQDLVTVLASMGPNFHPSHPMFEQIKPLLDLDNPITHTQQPK